MPSEVDTQAVCSPASLPRATAPTFVPNPQARDVSSSKKLLQKTLAANCFPS